MQVFHAVESYTRDNDFFIKFFLLDDSINLNRWGVTEDALRANLKSFIGKPFVITENFGHPSAESGDALFTRQEIFRKGDIVDVGYEESTGKAWGVAHIKDKDAIELIKAGKVKFVSPAIVFNEQSIQKNGNSELIINFEGAHVAGVKDPAYSVFKAQIKGQCNGSDHECRKQLMMVQACTDCGTFSKDDIKTAKDFPWDECMAKMMKEYGDEETAKKVCGKIKAQYGVILDQNTPLVQKIVEESLAKKLERTINSILVKIDLLTTLKEKYGDDPVNDEIKKELDRYEYDLEWLAIEYIKTDNEMSGHIESAKIILDAASKCVSRCLEKKKEMGKKIDSQAIATCMNEHGESKDASYHKGDCPDGQHMVDGKCVPVEKTASIPWSITASSGTNGIYYLQYDTDTNYATLTSCGNILLSNSYNDKIKKSESMTDPIPQVKTEDFEKVQNEVRDLTAKLETLSKEKKELVEKLDAERKKPIVEKIITAKVSLGKIKDEEKPAEFDRLIKRDSDFLTEMATEYDSIVEAKKVTEVKQPYVAKYTYNASLDPSKGDAVITALRSR